MGPNGLLPTSPGHTVGVSTQYSGALCNNCGGTATFWLEDLTTSNYTSFSISAPYPGWRAADFINEMHNDYYLPDFGSSVFTDCLTEDNSDDIWYLVTSNNDRMYMTTTGTSSGTVMADPGAADNYTNGFTDVWKNQGP